MKFVVNENCIVNGHAAGETITEKDLIEGTDLTALINSGAVIEISDKATKGSGE